MFYLWSYSFSMFHVNLFGTHISRFPFCLMTFALRALTKADNNVLHAYKLSFCLIVDTFNVADCHNCLHHCRRHGRLFVHAWINHNALITGW